MLLLVLNCQNPLCIVSFLIKCSLLFLRIGLLRLVLLAPLEHLLLGVVHRLLGQCLLVLSALVYPLTAVAAAQDRSSHVLVLGRISDDPRQHHGQLKPLLDYVVARMASVAPAARRSA